MNHFAILIQLLRDRKQVLVDIQKQIKLDSKIVSLLLSSSFCFACYGAIMEAFRSEVNSNFYSGIIRALSTMMGAIM